MELKLEHTESRLNTELAEANESLVSAMNDVTKCQEKVKGFEDLVKANETQRFGLKAELAGNADACSVPTQSIFSDNSYACWILGISLGRGKY